MYLLGSSLAAAQGQGQGVACLPGVRRCPLIQRTATLGGVTDIVQVSTATPTREIALKLAKAIVSATTIVAVERLAKADRQHAMTAEQWDADPWCFNPPL